MPWSARQCRPSQKSMTRLVAHIWLGEAAEMQGACVWMPASHLGPGPTHAINRRRPGSRETQSEVVSPEPGSRGTRAWGDEALPCGPHAVLSVNQTTSSWILHLHAQTTKYEPGRRMRCRQPTEDNQTRSMTPFSSKHHRWMRCAK